MKYLNSFNESIRASEAHNEIESLYTVINNKREMCFIAITEQRLIDPREPIKALRIALNNNLNIIPIKSSKDGVAFLVYKTDKQKAEKFAEFIESKEGYVQDSTAEEALYIGQQLEYHPDDIQEYINRRYKNAT